MAENKKRGYVARKRDRRNKWKNRVNSFAIVTVVIILLIIIGVKMNNMSDEKYNLEKRETKLLTEYEKESERTSELEQQRVYIQTKKYIEEAAKKLGFVYPDEIIFKPKK